MRLLARREALCLAALLLGLAVLTGGFLLMEHPPYVIGLEGTVDGSEVTGELDDQHSWFERLYNFTELSPRGKEVFRDLLAADRRSERKVVISGGVVERAELPTDFTYPDKQLESVGVPDRYVIWHDGTYYELRTFMKTGSKRTGTVGFALMVAGVLIVLSTTWFWYRGRGPPLLSTSTTRSRR